MNKTARASIIYHGVIAVMFLSFVVIGGWGLVKIKARLSMAQPMQVQPMAVKTIITASGTVEKTLPALATVKSAATVQIKAEVGGRLLSLPLREGDRVKSGQIIGVLDAREQEAQLQAAKARNDSVTSQVSATVAGLQVLTSQLDAAQTNLEFFSRELKRNEELFKEGAIAQSAYENTRNRHAEASSRLASLKSQIQSHKAQVDALVSQKKASEKDVMLWEVRRDYTEITAPVDGVISARLQEEGSRVLPGQAIYNVEDVAKTRLIMQIPQEAAASVKVAQVVMVRGRKDMNFRISRVYPVQNELRQVIVEAEADEEYQGLVYDMQIPVRIVVACEEGTVIPEEAVFIDFNRSDRFFVYIVKNDVAVRTPVSATLHGDGGKKLVDAKFIVPGTELAVGSYLENIRLPASFAVEVVK